MFSPSGISIRVTLSVLSKVGDELYDVVAAVWDGQNLSGGISHFPFLIEFADVRYVRRNRIILERSVGIDDGGLRHGDCAVRRFHQEPQRASGQAGRQNRYSVDGRRVLVGHFGVALFLNECLCHVLLRAGFFDRQRGRGFFDSKLRSCLYRVKIVWHLSFLDCQLRTCGHRVEIASGVRDRESRSCLLSPEDFKESATEQETDERQRGSESFADLL